MAPFGDVLYFTLPHPLSTSKASGSDLLGGRLGPPCQPSGNQRLNLLIFFFWLASFAFRRVTTWGLLADQRGIKPLPAVCQPFQKCCHTNWATRTPAIEATYRNILSLRLYSTAAHFPAVSSCFNGYIQCQGTNKTGLNFSWNVKKEPRGSEACMWIIWKDVKLPARTCILFWKWKEAQP